VVAQAVASPPGIHVADAVIAVRPRGKRATDADQLAERVAPVERARYAAELAGRAELVKRAKKLQDVLGEHQDAVVAAERLRGLAAAAAARQALVAGRLVEREEERRIGARADWPKTWRKLRETI